jgi:histidinol-phosphate aminotransferase
VVFLANPNNPTGTLLPGTAIRRLHAGLPPHALLVLDAAYAEFVRDAAYEDGAALVREHDNVLMLRTFSKAYGLAGARLGYAFGPPAVIDVLDRIRAPFNVSAAAQAAGIAALSDTGHLARCADLAMHGRHALSMGLARLGWQPVPSATNFVTARTPGGVPAAATVHALAGQGLLVRPLAGYGLPAHIRYTIGTHAEQHALLTALASL